MTLFKNGGTCATMMTPAQYVRAHRKARMRAKIEKAIDWLGVEYIGHPENTQAKWGNKNVH